MEHDPKIRYEYDIDIFLELMESFVNKIEKTVLDEIKEFEKKKGNIQTINKHPDLDYYMISNYYKNLDMDFYWESIFTETFPTRERSAGLITLFGWFEFHLNRLCILCEKHKKVKISYQDINGKGIDRAIKYLEKVIELEIPKNTQNRENIQIIKKIRNAFIHNDWEIIEGKEKEIMAFIKKQPSYISIKNKRITINNWFLKYTLETFNIFFEGIEKNNGFLDAFLEDISRTHTFWQKN